MRFGAALIFRLRGGHRDCTNASLMTSPFRCTAAIFVVLLCAFPGSASARPDPGCEEVCADQGRCWRVDDACVVLLDDDCRRSNECRAHGLCTARVPDLDHAKGRCIATRTVDCQKSEFCAWSKQCFLHRETEVCDDGKELNSTEALVAGVIALGVGGVGLIAGLVMSLRDELIPKACDDEFC